MSFSLSKMRPAFALIIVTALANPLPHQPQSPTPQGSVMDSSPLGSARVINACPFAVHSDIAHSPRPGVDGAPEQILSVLAPGENVEHPFLHDPGMCWLAVPMFEE
jgi:hypothetical protein